MKKLSDYGFRGTFREYQQRVLDNAADYLDDGRIHIVAAPGSGKTILGLEMICRLGENALILSPSIAIREQWKERFKQNFIDDKDDLDGIFSTDLKKPKQITSITYQGLYSAWKRTPVKKGGDDEPDAFEDYSGIDMLRTLKDNKITTVCLDEAHHLRAEWLNALQGFIKETESECLIIALTATPPYDSDKSEWNKYIDICGEIDDEIFVPELVRAKTLCPHQDYVHLSYPTGEELGRITEYKHRADEFLQAAFSGEVLAAVQRSAFYTRPETFEEELLDKPLFLKSLLSFLKASGDGGNKKLTSLLGRTEVRSFGYKEAENFFTELINDEKYLLPEDKAYISALVHKYLVVERKKVCISSNSRLDKMIVASAGKLAAIKEIVGFEQSNLGDGLRLLVLTDYIKSKTNIIGTDRPILQSGVAPIFELLRRGCPGLKLAALSGELVIVPAAVQEYLISAASGKKIKLSFKPVAGTQHSEVIFAGGSSHQKVALITKALNEGVINAVVGTKSLLGEGWDSPVINTLVLASFIGSYMLSNQMRGRAIRIDRNEPDKVSNIWHLVTVLPDYLTYSSKQEYAKKRLMHMFDAKCTTYDYETMSRRFNAFVGLNKYKDEIESGISRVLSHEEMEKPDIEKINTQTFSVAKDRADVAARWEKSLDKATDEIIIENIQPKETFRNKFYFFNILLVTLYSALTSAAVAPLIAAMVNIGQVNPVYYFIFAAAVCCVIFVYCYLIKKLLLYLSPHLTMKALAAGLLRAYKELEIINKNAELIFSPVEKFFISISIACASRHEQNTFNGGVSTLFSPIENPRYIIMLGGKFQGKAYYSFAVPDEFTVNKKIATVFETHMQKAIKRLEVVYTRSAEGRKTLNACRKHSFISSNYGQIYGRKKLKEKWE